MEKSVVTLWAFVLILDGLMFMFVGYNELTAFVAKEPTAISSAATDMETVPEKIVDVWARAWGRTGGLVWSGIMARRSDSDAKEEIPFSENESNASEFVVLGVRGFEELKNQEIKISPLAKKKELHAKAISSTHQPKNTTLSAESS